jgi:tRNA(Ser,Leu) C12 N-acetylase TAN1
MATPRRESPPALAWNVVATCEAGAFREAVRILAGWGEVARTGYYNVLVLRVADTAAFAESLAARLAAEPGLANFLSRVVPAEVTIDLADARDLECALGERLDLFLPRLAGRPFHVRVHRRGLRAELSGRQLEQEIGRSLLDRLAAAGTPGRADLTDPDYILAVEIVDHRAGLSLWSREQRQALPCLKLD